MVDFWAPCCSPCTALAPILEEIAGEHSDTLTIARLDIEENPDTFQRYQVKSIPTLLVFDGGKVLQTIVGSNPAQPGDSCADRLGLTVMMSPTEPFRPPGLQNRGARAHPRTARPGAASVSLGEQP